MGRRNIWLAACLAIAALPGIRALAQAQSLPLAAQDDARQFLFWMRRWDDAQLFQNDLIAQYFQHATPTVYSALYWLAHAAGLDPFAFNLLLPLPLALALAWTAFLLAEKMSGEAMAGFIAGVLCAFFAWLLDDLPSATPRSFAAPLFLAVLLAMAHKRDYLLAGLSALLCLVYPQAGLLALGVLALDALAERSRADLIRLGQALAAGLLALSPLAFALSPYGPTLSRAEALAMAPFQPGGRSEFFAFPDQPLGQYLCGLRAGLLPPEWGCYSAYKEGFAFAPVLALVLVGLAVAGLVWLALRQRPGSRLPLLTLLAGLALFAAAHVALFKLHLPGRYTQTPLRSLAMLALAVYAAHRLQGKPWRGLAVAVFGAGMAALMAFAPFLPRPEYVEGRHVEIYAALEKSPQESLVVGLDAETENIPAFAKRSILFGREYMIPYSKGYDSAMRERVRQAGRLWYAVDVADFKEAFDEMSSAQRGRKVYFLLRDGEGLAEAIGESWWARDFPELADWAGGRIAKARPVLGDLSQGCETAISGPLRLIDADCVKAKL